MLFLFFGAPVLFLWSVWAAVHWLTNWVLVDYATFAAAVVATTLVALVVAMNRMMG